MSLNIKKVQNYAYLPVLNNDGSYDLYSAEAYVIEPGDSVTVTTGLAISAPIGYHARVYSTRAAESNNIEVSSFCSINHYSHKYQTTRQTVQELILVLRNHGYEDYNIKRGSLIAVMVLHQIKKLPIYEVEELNDIAQDFSVKMKMRDIKNFPGQIRSWFLLTYKNNPTRTISKYTIPSMIAELEEFKKCEEYQHSKKKEDLEARFLYPRIRDCEEKITVDETQITPFTRLKEDHSLAKAKAHIVTT